MSQDLTTLNMKPELPEGLMLNRDQTDTTHNAGHVVIYIAQSTLPWSAWWASRYGCPNPAAFDFTTHHRIPPRHVWLPGGEQQLLTPHWAIIAIAETHMQSVNRYPLDPGNLDTVHSNWAADTHSGATSRILLEMTPEELRTLITDGHLDIEALQNMIALTGSPTSVFNADHWVDLFRAAINAACTRRDQALAEATR